MSVLDIDHPDTDFTVAVAHAADVVLSTAKRMTLVGSSSKVELLAIGDGERRQARRAGRVTVIDTGAAAL